CSSSSAASASSCKRSATMTSASVIDHKMAKSPVIYRLGEAPSAVGGIGKDNVSSGASSSNGPRPGPISAVVAPRRAAVINANDAQSASLRSPTTTTASKGPT